MNVRCKFKCDSVTYFINTATVKLSPVTSGSKENAEFFEYTPGGSIELNIVSHGTAQQFVPGEEYYVDFASFIKGVSNV